MKTAKGRFRVYEEHFAQGGSVSGSTRSSPLLSVLSGLVIGLLLVVTFNGSVTGAVTGFSEPACGDGTVDDGEACDDGNTAESDGCSAVWALETASSCYNGIQDADEEGTDCGGTCQACLSNGKPFTNIVLK